MRTLVFLLTHQNHKETELRVETWKQAVPADDLLIVTDVDEEEFGRIEHPHKVRSVDPRRRTRDHQRELQSITTAVHAVSQWMRDQDFTHVFLAEFDLLPLTTQLMPRLEVLLNETRADILAHELLRVDQTNSAHYLYHRGRPGFAEFWAKVTRRPEPTVVLSMLGTGSIWSRAAFDAVAAFDEPFPMYLEIYLPTLAHHLGARLVDFGRESRYIASLGDRADEVPAAQRDGALFIHPIKTMSEAIRLVD